MATELVLVVMKKKDADEYGTDCAFEAPGSYFPFGFYRAKNSVGLYETGCFSGGIVIDGRPREFRTKLTGMVVLVTEDGESLGTFTLKKHSGDGFDLVGADANGKRTVKEHETACATRIKEKGYPEYY